MAYFNYFRIADAIVLAYHLDPVVNFFGNSFLKEFIVLVARSFCTKYQGCHLKIFSVAALLNFKQVHVLVLICNPVQRDLFITLAVSKLNNSRRLAISGGGRGMCDACKRGTFVLSRR